MSDKTKQIKSNQIKEDLNIPIKEETIKALKKQKKEFKKILKMTEKWKKQKNKKISEKKLNKMLNKKSCDLGLCIDE